MQTCHVLLITSLRDLTSTVTIEALALGLPIICLDHCGFAHVVTPECGIKIPVTSPRQVAAEIAGCIKKIWEDEAWRQGLSSGALLRARDFSWENKAKQIGEIYKKVLGSP
jgi:glycosyltransferase involved in cell wall biosynthesis